MFQSLFGNLGHSIATSQQLTANQAQQYPAHYYAQQASQLQAMAQQQAQQAPVAEPAVAPAEPHPVPARLSDLQARQQKFETLTKIKKKIEKIYFSNLFYIKYDDYNY